MIGFIFKTTLILAVIVGGSVLLVNTVPFLKANILEIVNPRVQEGKLVQKLQSTLSELDTAPTKSARDALVTQSQDIIQEIVDLNEAHDGVVDGIVTKIGETLLGTVVTPTPSPSDAASSSPSTPTPAVVTVTVTVTPVPSPCE